VGLIAARTFFFFSVDGLSVRQPGALERWLLFLKEADLASRLSTNWVTPAFFEFI